MSDHLFAGLAPDLPANARLYSAMLLVRRTEERLLALFNRGLVSGTTHACIGQEANAVGIIGLLDPGRDHVVSNHRCHGHYLAFGGSLAGLMGEVLGLDGGVCAGRGGSQHLRDGGFLSNGIQGGGAPVACGLALGARLAGREGGVTALCLGDGTLGQGVLYEALNMAALWSLPVLFLVEDNGYAQTTPAADAVAGSMVARGAAFGIRTAEIDSTDVLALRDFGREAVGAVRDSGRPLFAVVHTQRLCAHSKGDDTRPPEAVAALCALDPLAVHGARLAQAEREAAEAWARARIDAALAAVAPGLGGGAS